MEYTRYRAKTDIFLFDSFGLDRLKHSIIQDDRSVIKKILFGMERMTRTDSKITLCNIRFNVNAYKNVSTEELNGLSDTTINFFHFVQAFGNKLKLRNFVNIWMIEDRRRNLDSVTCCIFQLCFFFYLFNPNENNKTKLDLIKEQ